ncbi:hypothetical protein, partial [Burkholderia sp. SIMBA_024]|uniref:hypothetical protein n=1 Tax=Burkholderia sp. SIMBA_024 TaxID=3085768 RepID=UPI00397D08A7
MDKQIADTTDQRSELRDQISTLRSQLAQLEASAPVVPDPVTPETQAAIDAERERQEQIAAMLSAIGQAQAGVEAADAQLTQLRESQTEAAAQQEEATRLEAEQKAAAEVRGTAVRVADVAGRGGGPSTDLRTTFTTPASNIFLLRRDASGDDT